MSEQINVTVPANSYSALLRASEMLAGIAADIKTGAIPPICRCDERSEPATTIPVKSPDSGAITAVVTDGQTFPVTEETRIAPREYTPLAADEMGADQTSGAAIEAKIPASEGGTGPEKTTEQPPIPPVTEEAEQPPTPPAGYPDAIRGESPVSGVELANGIPWDARIHSGSKAKYATAPHGWKLKRSVDKALVEQVEAELRAAMAASPTNPIESTPTEPNAATVFGEGFENPDHPAVFSDGSNPTPPAATAPINFVELNLAITSAGISHDRVTAAVNAAGLQSYMLLPARADLIPFVAGQLGLGPIVEVPA